VHQSCFPGGLQMVNAPEPHSRQQPPNDASPSQLVAGRPDKGPDSHLKQERSGIECPTVVGVGFSRTGRCGREDVAELGALDVPTVQYILPAGNRPVLDGGLGSWTRQASRLRSFRRREKYALSHRQPRSQRRRDVIPDPLARFGPDLSGAYTAQYPEP
jgi:hypothetical protein